MKARDGHHELAKYRGFRLFAVEDAAHVRGYAVERDGKDTDSAFNVIGVSVEGVERRLRQLVDRELEVGEATERMPRGDGAS